MMHNQTQLSPCAAHAVETFGELPATNTIQHTLAERGKRYGDFEGHAHVTQAIKGAMASSRNWDSLPADMREALDMVAHKIGRILNGDPNYVDSWHDIIGYTRLVEERLQRES